MEVFIFVLENTCQWMLQDSVVTVPFKGLVEYGISSSVCQEKNVEGGLLSAWRSACKKTSHNADSNSFIIASFNFVWSHWHLNYKDHKTIKHSGKLELVISLQDGSRDAEGMFSPTSRLRWKPCLWEAEVRCWSHLFVLRQMLHVMPLCKDFIK